MKKILIINTGGTFSSCPGEHGLSPGMKGGDILSRLDQMEPDIHIEMEDFCSLDSANIHPEDWKKLAEKVGEITGIYDGIVIIHGTDTMAYTSSMLSFMLQNVPVPVVLTGSQLPIGVPMSDAVHNCHSAVQMAACGEGGVYVAFDRKIIAGCRASKVRTRSFHAFESINFPYVGEIDAFGLHIFKKERKEKREFQIQTAYSDRIAVLKLFPGMRPDILSLLQQQGYEGIVLEGFGLGGVSFLKNDFPAEIRRLSEAGIPVLVDSQCLYEGSDLNVYETGKRILECGGIPVYDMTKEAVITKLMWSLGQSKNEEDIRKMFQKNLADEVTLYM